MRSALGVPLICGLAVAGCASSQRSDSSEAVVGTWVHQDKSKDAISAWAFTSDHTGVFLAGSPTAGPVGSDFTYATDRETMTITIRDRGPMRALLVGNTIQLQTPSGATVLRRTKSDEDAEVQFYLKGLEELRLRNAEK